MNYIENIDESFNGNALMGILEAFLSLFSVGVNLLIMVLEFAIFIAMYLMVAIPVYKMAKSAGHPQAWLAWFPIFNIYLIMTLPEGEFVLFGKDFLRMKRKTAAWIAIGCNLVPFVFMMVFCCVGALTMGIGLLIVLPISIVILMFTSGISYAFYWRAHYDLFKLYNPGEEHEQTNLVISLIGLMVQILYPIYLIIICKNAPAYGVGRYSETHHE